MAKLGQAEKETSQTIPHVDSRETSVSYAVFLRAFGQSLKENKRFEYPFVVQKFWVAAAEYLKIPKSERLQQRAYATQILNFSMADNIPFNNFVTALEAAGFEGLDDQEAQTFIEFLSQSEAALQFLNYYSILEFQEKISDLLYTNATYVAEQFEDKFSKQGYNILLQVRTSWISAGNLAENHLMPADRQNRREFLIDFFVALIEQGVQAKQ